jgi:Arc/MetJ-type ribon-helix-helix transcriptional regulator
VGVVSASGKPASSTIVLHLSVMATTTVRLDPDEERLLDGLAEVYGGRSSALREGLRLLAAHTQRRSSLADLLLEWESETGPVSEEAVAAMRERYELDS